jgi:hypothetical protein
MTQQVVDIVSVFGESNETDTACEHNAMILNLEWLRERVENFLRDDLSVVDVSRGLQNDHEFVSADARDRIGSPDAGPQPICRSVQQVIAYRMTASVIGHFKPIKIKVEDMNRVIEAAGTR